MSMIKFEYNSSTKCSEKCSKYFAEQLDNDTSDDEENQTFGINTDKCLITLLSFENNYVTLECGHKFNYNVIFNDVYNHKKNFQHLESVRLKDNQIRCPYCRNIQQTLLHPIEGRENIYGVNTLNMEPKRMYEFMRMYDLARYYHKYSWGKCCDGIHHSELNGPLEMLVSCNNNKVKYSNITGMVYCPNHFIKNVISQLHIEHIDIEIMKQILLKFIKTVNKTEKKKITTKIDILSMISDNLKSSINDNTTKEIKEKEKVDNSEYNAKHVLQDVTNNKYYRHNRCYAFFTTGKSKGSQCNCCVSSFNSLYCKKHTTMVQNINQFITDKDLWED